MLTRDEARYQLILDRGGELTAYCDWEVIQGVARPRMGTDMHEIFNRAQTYKDSMARQWSYQPELCAWLCNECHIGIVHGRLSPVRVAEPLLLFNVRLYGYERVKAALERFAVAQRTHVPFEVPIEFPIEKTCRGRYEAREDEQGHGK